MTLTLDPLDRLHDGASTDTSLESRESVIAMRAQCLAAGLRKIGVSRGSSLAVLICDHHAEDRDVAVAAAQIVDAVVTLHSLHEPIAALAASLESHRGGVLLACSEGVEIWRQTTVPLRVVGDGPGVLWWRAMELQEGLTCRTAADASSRWSGTSTAGSSLAS
jgi:hypothetical protein